MPSHRTLGDQGSQTIYCKQDPGQGCCKQKKTAFKYELQPGKDIEVGYSKGDPFFPELDLRSDPDKRVAYFRYNWEF